MCSEHPPSGSQALQKWAGIKSWRTQQNITQRMLSSSSRGLFPLCSADQSPEMVASSYLTAYFSALSTASVGEAVASPGGALADLVRESGLLPMP